MSKPDDQCDPVVRLGCCDGSCELDPPIGMHTNGGKCYCLQDLQATERRRVRAFIREQRTQISELKKALADMLSMLGDAKCSYDHNGWCQEHTMDQDDECKCPVPGYRALLEGPQ